MASRSRGGGDEGVDLQLFQAVLDIATKSTAASTAVAKGLQTVEKLATETKESADELKGVVLQLQAKVDALEKQVAGKRDDGYVDNFKKAVLNPQTVLLILAIAASALGIRISEPVQLAGQLSTSPTEAAADKTP